MRGLKYLEDNHQKTASLSHSTRVRGLKSFPRLSPGAQLFVALYTSAWIEIGYNGAAWMQCCVALYTSAWIEIFDVSSSVEFKKVALYTSAWIEIIKCQ